MQIIRQFMAGGDYVRPVIAEMGGKNATIITDKANVEKAAYGVMRSAFGFTGQKCSACSRVYVHNDIKDKFLDKLVELTGEIKVGDPTIRENYM